MIRPLTRADKDDREEETGNRMQRMSQNRDNAYQPGQVPQRWAEQRQPDATPPEYDEQENQWAVLRHEVEEVDMKRQEEQVQMGWSRRDTEDDAVAPQAPVAMQENFPGQRVDIVVVGVGGGGMNALGHMIDAQVRGVRFLAMNTDAQALAYSKAAERICLGQYYTKGLGAGGNANMGMKAAAESADEIRQALEGADLVFVAAGMGGGTGTGAAPVVAALAKKLGALTIGIVTLPFAFEGTQRKRIAEAGILELRNAIDALITVPNDRLLTTTSRDRSLADAFKLADDVLRQGVQGIAEVINVPGMVNVDFADVRSVLQQAGTALMSIGQGQGRERARRAAEEAIAGGFLNVSIRGAQRVLFNISGGDDMTLFEVNEVAERIRDAIDDTADITFGAVVDPTLADTIRVTLIAAGMQAASTLHIPAVRLDRAHPSTYNPAPSLPVPHYPASNDMPRQSPPFRQPRGQDDARGSWQRPEAPRRRPTADEQNDAIDVPPFLKRFPQ